MKLNVKSSNAKQHRRRFSLRKILIILRTFPIFHLSRKDTLIFRSSRQDWVGDGFVDKYTRDYEHENGLTAVGIYETNLEYSNFKNNLPSIYIAQYIEYVGGVLLYFLYWFTTRISNSFTRDLNVFLQLTGDLSSKKEIILALARFKISFWLYLSIFKVRRPTKIILTNYVSKLSLIGAAKHLGISVVEVQHGFTSPALLLYHFPSAREGSLAYFPDVFIYRDKYLWLDVDIPLKSDCVIEESSAVAGQNINLIRGEEVLYISQPDSSNLIVEHINSIIDRINISNIHVKLHPGELSNIMLIDRLKSMGLKVIMDAENFHLASYSKVIGAYSTMLVDAWKEGCSVYSISGSHIVYIDSFIQRGLIREIKLGQEP
ncbi:hypothetical protein N9R36_00940 [bacterium]|nr:hypothetical protein [bacterium]